MSGQDIIIEQLRADVARLEAERDWFRSEAERLGAAIPSGYALLAIHTAVSRSNLDAALIGAAIDAINRLDKARRMGV